MVAYLTAQSGRSGALVRLPEGGMDGTGEVHVDFLSIAPHGILPVEFEQYFELPSASGSGQADFSLVLEHPRVVSISENYSPSELRHGKSIFRLREPLPCAVWREGA